MGGELADGPALNALMATGRSLVTDPRPAQPAVNQSEEIKQIRPSSSQCYGAPVADPVDCARHLLRLAAAMALVRHLEKHSKIDGRTGTDTSGPQQSEDSEDDARIRGLFARFPH